jgi:fucose permease
MVMCLNTIVPLLKVAYFGVIMNTLHFFYGVGATFTQRLSGFLIDNNVSWRNIFVAFALMYLSAIIVYFFVEQPPRKVLESHKQKFKKFELPLIAMFIIALGFYVAAEIQTANWLLNYLKETYQFTSNDGSFYVAFFFGALSVGRLFGGYILEKIGYLRGIIISSSIALVLYSIGLLNENTLIVLSISGLFFAIVYPTTVLVLQRFFEDNAERAVAIVTMTASFVNMGIGALIGVLNDQIGPKLSFVSIPVSLFVSLVFMVGIAINIKRVEKLRIEDRS